MHTPNHLYLICDCDKNITVVFWLIVFAFGFWLPVPLRASYKTDGLVHGW
jgi:hypothetical protein